MLPLRPLTQSLSRPSIQELSTFLLSPKTFHARCIHHAPSRALRKASPQSSYSVRKFAASRSSSPKSHDRGPRSEESTQTDFSSLDVLGNTPVPSTSIDACLWDGFHLNSGVKVGGGSGVLLLSGEAFGWRPWEAGGGQKYKLVNEKGQFEVGEEGWGVLSLIWPKPDLLILGLGKEMRPLSPSTKQYLNNLGIRIDIQDTRNAAAQFNLLATERGVGSVAAALIPLGWQEGVGVR